MGLIIRYLKKYKGWFLLDLFSVFGFALVELGIPTIVAAIIDNGVLRGSREYIWKMGGLIAAISLAGVAGTILLGYCCARISSGITADIREDVFVRAQGFSHSEFDKFGISSMITRTNNDAFQIQMFLNVLLRTALMAPVMIIASFAMTMRASLDLSVIIGATVPVIILGVFVVAKLSKPISERQQEAQDGMNRVSRENLNGIRVVRAFNNDAYEEQRFGQENEKFTRSSRQMFILMMLTQPLFFLVMNVAGALIFWRGGQLIGLEMLQVGQLTAFMDYLFHAMISVMLFCSVFMMYPKAAVSAGRISQVLNTVPLVQNTPGSPKLAPPVEKITYENVTFAYPGSDEPVLKGVSFTAKKGETVAFIGSTGSGKSTLVSLLPRFYDVSSGRICINGRDIRQTDLVSLRDAMGYIPQKAVLFSGTIEENIRFGKEDATREEIVHAAQTAQAYDFIMEKEGGFQAPIAESGSNTSGGQRQRLSIARALVRRPSVYVFDDSFSALDFRTDANLRKALRKETGESIVLIVAQRVSTIMDADKIIVLDEGHIAGQGTHRELLDSCPVYREIAASQLREEELAR